jgi:hypothetical protein
MSFFNKRKERKKVISKGGEGICPPEKKGFTQHYGECWNDSDMMIFCFTDGIKEKVQVFFTFIDSLILLNPSIELDKIFLSLYDKKFDAEHIENFNLFIPFNINYIDDSKNDYKFFKRYAISYISNMYRRYKNLMNENIQRLETLGKERLKGTLGPIESLKSLKRVESFDRSLNCVRSNYNLENINIKVKKENRNRHGGSALNTYFSLCIINYFIMTYNYREVVQNYSNVSYLKFEVTNKFSNADISDVLAVSIQSSELNENKIMTRHKNAFIKCNGISYFYDDNGVIDTSNVDEQKQMIEFSWEKHIENMKEEIINKNNFFDSVEFRSYLKKRKVKTLTFFKLENNLEYFKEIVNMILKVFKGNYSVNSFNYFQLEKDLNELMAKEDLPQEEEEEEEWEKELKKILANEEKEEEWEKELKKILANEENEEKEDLSLPSELEKQLEIYKKGGFYKRSNTNKRNNTNKRTKKNKRSNTNKRTNKKNKRSNTNKRSKNNKKSKKLKKLKKLKK